MINCLDCNGSLINVFYKCTVEDYRYIDENDNLIHIKTTHNLDLEDEEVNTQVKDIYCKACNSPVYYPTCYKDNNFCNNDFIIKEFFKYEIKNLIHQFTNINCSHCNNILKKGYFTNTEMEQNEENLLKYSYPTDFKNTIHVYDEETNEKIKDIEIDLIELDITETDIGKKIIYCPDCNYFIMNNLNILFKN